MRRQLSTNLRTRSSVDRACCEWRFVPFLFIVLSLFFFVPFVFIVPFVLIVLVPLGSAGALYLGGHRADSPRQTRVSRV